jgi:MFS family permease
MIRAPKQQKLPSNLGRILFLLALSVFINYIDRGNLSIAAPLIKDQLRLSASQLGILLSAFFWTYACFQIVSGWLVDRFEVGWVMAAGFFLWSSATAVTGLVHGFALLLVVRLVLGVGESVAYPSYSKILARYFPEDRRGFANSVIVAGLALGPGFGMYAGGMLMARFGWRSFFVVLGSASLLWLLPWMKWMPREPRVLSTVTVGTPSIAQILRQRSAWGTCAGLFSTNYLSYFFITWLPFYLVRERNFSMQKMAEVAGGSYLLAALAATICGRFSDRWIDSGATPTRVRKTFTGAGMTLASIFLIACVLSGPALSIVMVVLATISMAICASNMWAITQTIAGPQAAGRWTGVQNFVGNLSGVVAPALTGLVVDRTGQFFWAFLITAAVSLLGALSWIFLVGPVTPVMWGQSHLFNMPEDVAEIA